MEPYSYNLPEGRIAQRPVRPYHNAKLLVFSEEDESYSEILDRSFLEFPDFITARDLLVFNESRVLPARMVGTLEGGGEAELLYSHDEDGFAVCLGRPMRKFKASTRIEFSGTQLSALVDQRVGEKQVRVSFHLGEVRIPSKEALSQLGVMPIPPYIRQGRGDESDREDYQTHFARVEGSIAAPTASLHFTPELMKVIRSKDIETCFTTLHVGTASFLPLTEGADGDLTPPSSERFDVSDEVIERIRVTKEQGGRVIGVGTTVVRALESAFREDIVSSPVNASDLRSTELFIRPGFKFSAIDALVTNFHQPNTTHLFIIEALLGRERMADIYQHALAHDYRFLSYGDGMFIPNIEGNRR